MTYKELFKDYYADNIFQQLQKNLAFARFLNSIADTSPSVDFLMRTGKSKTGSASNIHPDDFIKHCQSMGFAEGPDLEKFIQSVDETGFMPQYIFDCIDPPFPDTSEPEMCSVTDLHWYIRNTGFPISLFDMEIGADKTYQLYSYDDILRIMDANPSNHFSYEEQSRDCDDFVRIFLGGLSRKNKGNIACGQLEANMVKDNGEEVLHALCGTLTKEKNVLVLEPQSDSKVWKFGEPFDWAGYTKIELLKMRG